MASEEMRRLRNRAALLKIDADYFRKMYIEADGMILRLLHHLEKDDVQEALKLISVYCTTDDFVSEQWVNARKAEKRRQRTARGKRVTV